MDVHPTKNVSIGIDPYPYYSSRGIPAFDLTIIWRCPDWAVGHSQPRLLTKGGRGGLINAWMLGVYQYWIQLMDSRWPRLTTKNLGSSDLSLRAVATMLLFKHRGHKNQKAMIISARLEFWWCQICLIVLGSAWCQRLWKAWTLVNCFYHLTNM